MSLICAVLHSPSSLSTQALGQKGDSPAPISPLSPLHSPDSLEELSLTESPNQPPTSGFAASFGSFSTQAPTIHSKDMPWEREEGDSGPGRSKNKEDLLDPLAGPYLSLGKDPGPHNPCEDSGVSFSPEEKLISSVRSSTGPSPVNPQMMVPESYLASSNPTEHWDSPFLASQDNSKVSMDSFSKDTAPLAPPTMSLTCTTTSLMKMMTWCTRWRRISTHLKAIPHWQTVATPILETPSPTAGPQKCQRVPLLIWSSTAWLENPRIPHHLSRDVGKTFEHGQDGLWFTHAVSESVLIWLSKMMMSEKEEDSAMPPSLPDILKSSPLNPEKMDSGSSEGSPEEQSPILRTEDDGVAKPSNQSVS